MMRRRRVGDPFSMRASEFNAFADAAQAHQRNRRASTTEPDPKGASSTIVRVHNTTEAAVERFGVLGIDGPIIRPEDNRRRFEERVTLRGVAPTAAHLGTFVILLEPLRAGAVGRAVLHGVTVCRVQFPESDGDDLRFADINVDGETNAPLKAQGYGPVQILWRVPPVEGGPEESGIDGGSASSTYTEEIDGGSASSTYSTEVDGGSSGSDFLPEEEGVWCVVRLGNCTRGVDFRVRCTIDGGANGTSSTTATWTWTVETLDGATIATEVLPVRYRPATEYVEPTGAVLGEAFYDEEGDLVLYELDLWEDTEDC